MSNSNNVTISRGDQPLTDQEIALALTQLWLNNEDKPKGENIILAVYEKALEKVRNLNE